jgi:hypothetical protein
MAHILEEQAVPLFETMYKHILYNKNKSRSKENHSFSIEAWTITRLYQGLTLTSNTFTLKIQPVLFTLF